MLGGRTGAIAARSAPLGDQSRTERSSSPALRVRMNLELGESSALVTGTETAVRGKSRLSATLALAAFDGGVTVYASSRRGVAAVATMRFRPLALREHAVP